MNTQFKQLTSNCNYLNNSYSPKSTNIKLCLEELKGREIAKGLSPYLFGCIVSGQEERELYNGLSEIGKKAYELEKTIREHYPTSIYTGYTGEDNARFLARFLQDICGTRYNSLSDIEKKAYNLEKEIARHSHHTF